MKPSPGIVPVPYHPYVCTFNCTVLFHSHSHDQNITIFLRSHHPSSTTPCPFPLRATPFPSPLCPLPPSYVTVAKVGIYLSLACWSFYIWISWNSVDTCDWKIWLDSTTPRINRRRLDMAPQCWTNEVPLNVLFIFCWWWRTLIDAIFWHYGRTGVGTITVCHVTFHKFGRAWWY